MANKDALLQVKITEKQKKQIEAAAEAQDVKVPAYVLTALDFYASFDPAFWKRIENFSRRLNMPQYLILQNLAISWMARKAAEAEVWGLGASRLKEFAFTDSGPITGEELFGSLKCGFVDQLENEMRRELLEEAEHGHLSNDDQEWLKIHRPNTVSGTSKIDPVTDEAPVDDGAGK